MFYIIQALTLATELGISSLIEVRLEHAQLLERQGEYREALSQYECLLKDGLKFEQLHTVKVTYIMHPLCVLIWSQGYLVYVPENSKYITSIFPKRWKVC